MSTDLRDLNLDYNYIHEFEKMVAEQCTGSIPYAFTIPRLVLKARVLPPQA